MDWWVWTLIGIGATAGLGGLGYLIYWLVSGEGVESHDHYATTPTTILGYMLANQTHNLSLKETRQYGNILVANNITATGMECLSYTESGYYRDVDKALDIAIPRAKILLEHNLTLQLIPFNWNSKGICQDISFDIGRHVFHRLLDELGWKGIMLEMCVEWGANCRNRRCWHRARQLCKYAAENWPGMKLWNKGARPAGAPPHHYIDYHPNGTHDVGPENCIVTTDNSNLLNELGGLRNYLNPDKVSAFARKCKDFDRGFMLYDYMNPQNPCKWDIGVIEAMGRSI